MSKKVLIVLADGFEEIEAVTPIDVLRRAGLEVTVAGVGKKEIEGAHGITIQTDIILEKYQEIPDCIVLPGGMPGASNLSQSKELGQLLTKMNQEKRLIGAICASPAVVLAPRGLLDGKKATCYPGFEKNLSSKTSFTTERVVHDGNIITSRGPGSAFEFALELAEKLVGAKEVQRLSEAMVAKV